MGRMCWGFTTWDCGSGRKSGDSGWSWVMVMMSRRAGGIVVMVMGFLEEIEWGSRDGGSSKES